MHCVLYRIPYLTVNTPVSITKTKCKQQWLIIRFIRTDKMILWTECGILLMLMQVVEIVTTAVCVWWCVVCVCVVCVCVCVCVWCVYL